MNPSPNTAFARAPRPAERAGSARRSTVERMADTMTVMAVNGEPVTAESLRLRGFTSAEVAEHGGAAADMATSLRRASAL